MPPSTTPRKSVHYEPIPPPPPHFPLPPPFNERMIGFGLPDLSVPEGRLGPKHVDWSKERETSDLLDRLQSDQPNAPIEHYDMRHLSLAGAGIRQACMVWKSPVRRACMRVLDLRHSGLDDSSAVTFASFLFQAPSQIAPVHIKQLQIGSNAIWSHGAGQIMTALTQNAHVSVEQLSLADTHIGVVESPPQPNNTKKKSDEGDATPHAEEDENQADAAAIARGARFKFRLEKCALAFSPLVDFLSAAHSRLRVLDLRQCGLDDIFLCYLAEGLRHSSTVEVLYLGHNDLSCIGVSALALALGAKEVEPPTPTPEVEPEPTSRSTSRAHGHAQQSNKKGAQASHASAASSAKKKKVEEEEPAPEPIPLIQPMPVFALPAGVPALLNSSLTHLSIRDNRVGPVGIDRLLAAAGAHKNLVEIEIGEQRLTKAEREDVKRIEQQIHGECARNAYAGMRSLKANFSLGFHPRAGANSTLMTLVAGAKSIASGAESQAAASASSALSTPSGPNRRLVHSRTESRVPIPELPLSTNNNNNNNSTNGTTEQGGNANISTNASNTGAHVGVLTQALEEVWQFLS